MVDPNENLNANLEDITKVLEDMDSLDMELLNDSFRKPKSTTNILKDTSVQLDGELKKKVLFKDDPIEGDPLSGLFSDDESEAREKKSLFSSNSKSSLMEDLFKIKTPITSTTSIRSSNDLDSKFNIEQREANQLFSQKPNSYLASKSNLTTSKSEPSKERNVQKLKSVSIDEENVLTNLNDKLGMIEKPRRASLKESFLENKLDTSSNIKKLETEKTIQHTSIIQDAKLNPSNQTIIHSASESRKGRRSAKVINDPLGLLSTDLLSEQNVDMLKIENTATKDFVTQNTKTKKALPEWLGGSEKLEDIEMEKQQEEVAKDNKISNTANLKTTTGNLTDVPDFPQHVSLLFGAQLNQQNALINMQQQEHELRTATILSQQNEQLNKVSAAQHTMLHNQEEQFNALLKLQFERQALLDKQITKQQERINQYINALTTLPVPVISNITSDNNCESKSDENEKESVKEKEKMESIIKILQTENTKLESKLSSINEKHYTELTFQAEFYEKQITFLKDAIMKSEERFKQEIECLETDYITKLEKLKNEKLQLEDQYKEEINNLKNEQSQRIEEICKLHSENTQLLQKEYSNIIQSISKAKQAEDQMVQAMTGRKYDIEDMLQKANFIISTIEENQKNLEIKHNEVLEFQENTLKVHEADIKAQRIELKQQNSVLEEHRNTFIETTEKFNIRLTQLVTELQKQNKLCNQTQEALDKRATNLIQERELFEEKMKWERDFAQILKESWIKEQEKQLKLLAKEKEAMAKEKAELEVLSKLTSSNSEIAKIELEAAIRSAQEITASATREKLKWQEKINDLSAHKQILQDKENLLVLRAKELENLTESALIKKEEGMKALQNAKYLENQNKERYNKLQMQIRELMEREKKFATERYNVTKGRMFSLAYETEKIERDMNVSHHVQSDVLSLSDVQTKSVVTSELMNIVDPNIIMLKFDYNDEIDSINKYM